MFESYQIDRIEFIKDILKYFGNNFILKGGTALSLYYGLDRYSEDLDFDSISNNMNFINRLKTHKDFRKWNINIKKDTDTTFRAMIDYGANSTLGAYPLKIEVSNRNRILLQQKALTYDKINNVSVYTISELIKMKAIAFSGRDKIRDFYDLGYLLKKFPSKFNKDSLLSIHQKISYAGEEELNLLLKDEVNRHKLIANSDISNIDNYAQTITKSIETLLTKPKEQTKQINKSMQKSNKTRDFEM